MNYFEFYCGDYARDTAHLSLAEHGAFLMLLSAYYSTERPLPADHAGLFRIARAMSAAEQKSVRTVADEFFPVASDGLRHNARADLEIIKARKRIETARDNGKRGGRPPKKNPAGNPVGFDPVTQQEPAGKAPHAPPVNQELPPTAGADAPAEPDPIWGTGLRFLTRKGVPEPQARKFLGKLKREAGDIDAAALLAQAETDDITEPIPWLSRGAVTARERKSGGTHATSTHGGRLSASERVARINAEAERRGSNVVEGEFALVR